MKMENPLWSSLTRKAPLSKRALRQQHKEAARLLVEEKAKRRRIREEQGIEAWAKYKAESKAERARLIKLLEAKE